MKKLLATFGGVGLLPGMPGTYASLGAAVIYYLLLRRFEQWTPLVVAALTVLAGWLTVVLWPWASDHFKKNDPRQYVLDEVAGQWGALLLVSPFLSAVHPLLVIVAGFFLFRGFDVAKPYPINRLERLPRGWGVLLDDLAAGVYAGIGFWLLVLISGFLTGSEMVAAAI